MPTKPITDPWAPMREAMAARGIQFPLANIPAASQGYNWKAPVDYASYKPTEKDYSYGKYQFTPRQNAIIEAAMAKNPSQQALIDYYRAVFRPTQFSEIEKGKVGPGGAIFGNTSDFGNWHRKQQDAYAKQAGSALWSAGIDPNDPQRDLKARAFVAARTASPTTNHEDQYYQALERSSFGRGDAKAMGLPALQAKYKDAPYSSLFDVAIRQVAGQNALPPREFDFMQIVDPIIEAGLTWASGGNPTLAMMYGAGRGGSENGWLGGFLGGLQGYGVANTTAGIQAAGGPMNYLSNTFSNIGSELGSFATNPVNYLTTAAKNTGSNIANAFSNPFSETLTNVNQYMPPDIAARAVTPASLLAGSGISASTLARQGANLIPRGQMGPPAPPMQALGPAPAAAPASAAAAAAPAVFDPWESGFGKDDINVYNPYSDNYATYAPTGATYGVKEGGMIKSNHYADGGTVMIDPMNPMARIQHKDPMNPMGNLPAAAHTNTPNLRTASYGLASLGRQGDSTLVHMTPAEVQGLQRLAQANGTSLTTNPVTGLPEAFKLKDLLPTLGGAALSLVFPDLSPLSAGLLTGAATGLITGDWEKGLYGGIGGFGGSTLTKGLMQAGAPEGGVYRSPSVDEVARETGDLGATGLSATAGGQGLKAMGSDFGANLSQAGRGASNVFSKGLSAFPKVEGAGIMGEGGKALLLSSLAGLTPAIKADIDRDAAKASGSARPIEKNPYAAYGQEPYKDPGPLHYEFDEEGNPKYLVDLQGNIVQQLFNTGGITALARGGMRPPRKGGYLDGPGDGMSDSIPATIEDKQPARLADGEFVIPADVVSHIGNGSSKAGAKRLYAMMDRIRHARTGNKKQGKQINPNKYLPA